MLITGLAGQSASRCRSYLFGSVTSVTPADVLTTVLLAVVVIVLCVGLAPQLFAVAQDAEFARVAGVQVRFYNLLVAVLAAVTVTVAMRTVGLLLVSALMVVPVATAQQLTALVPRDGGDAMVLGLGARWVGCCWRRTSRSIPLNVAPGTTIVLLALAGFVLAWPAGPLAALPGGAACLTSRPSHSAHPPAPGRHRRPGDARRVPLGPRDPRGAWRERGHAIGLATVYRTLQLLAEHDEVDVIRATEGGEAGYRRCSTPTTTTSSAARAAPPSRSRGRPSSGGRAAIAEEHGYADVSHTLEIFGICARCS